MTGVSGIRGIVGEGMTPEVSMLWSGAFGTWVGGGKVVVGRDSRPSGEMLELAVKAGLMAAGCDVDDVGMMPTPVIALAVERRGAAGGIVITASHNPQDWNALKFIRPDGRMLTAQDFIDLEQIVSEGPLRSVRWDSIGTLNRWDSADITYVTAVTGMRILELDKLERKQFKVALDCINGAGSFLYPDLLEALGCQVVSINADGSGLFPHPPEPLPENLTDLSRTVVQERCAVGFAVDPDGDRLAAVDSEGNPIGEEATLGLAVRAVLEKQPGPVVVNSLTSQLIDDIAAEFGVECHRTRVGEANVASSMKELGAVIGGEGNGGVIFPELHLVRDAGVGMALILNRLAAEKKGLRELRDQMPTYRMLKAAYQLGENDPDDLIKAVADNFDHDQLSHIDGLRITHPDGWVHLRPSNTEPILRVYAESRDEDNTRRMLDEVMEQLKQVSGVNQS